MKEHDIRYISSREIISAELRLATALGFFHGNNDLSFLECYALAWINLSSEYYTDLKEGQTIQEFAQELIQQISPEQKKELEFALNYDHYLLENGLVEEMFSHVETKLKEAKQSVSGRWPTKQELADENFEATERKLHDINISVGGEKMPLSDFVLKAFGITKENNPQAFRYISEVASPYNLCLDIRNSIGHNDEDDQIIQNDLQDKENKDINERRFILRSDLNIELLCNYCSAPEKVFLPKDDPNKFDKFEAVISLEDFEILLYILNKIAEQDKAEGNLIETSETKQAQQNFSEDVLPQILKIKKKFDFLNISEKECQATSCQSIHNHKFLYEQKKNTIRYISKLKNNPNQNFGKFWATELKNKSNDTNKVVVDMVHGIGSAIISNMLYQVFSADKLNDVKKDVITKFLLNNSDLTQHSIDTFMQQKTKQLEEIKTTQKFSGKQERQIGKIITGTRNALLHGFYVDDFRGGIYVFDSTDQVLTEQSKYECFGSFNLDEMLKLSSLKEIHSKLLTSPVKQAQKENTIKFTDEPIAAPS